MARGVRKWGLTEDSRATLNRIVSRRVALVLCLLAAACSTDTAESLDYAVKLEVRDGWVREPGTECAGSRPFLYVHRDAAFRVEDPGGEVVASGRLPEGRAVEALREDLGVPRVPTFCRFSFGVALPTRGGYRFVLEEGAPLEFSAAAPSTPVTLIIQ